MKLRISVSLDLTPEQVKILTRMAKSGGHGFDGTKAPGKLIRRMLESNIKDTVAYCHERTGEE